MPEPTPPQTVGPFFHPCLLRLARTVLAGPEAEGERIRLEGRVLDGDGAPVDDAMVEMWQADSFGRFRHPLDDREGPRDAGFLGFGRTGTDAEGRFAFDTVKPGRVPWPGGGWQAPHVCLHVFARGLLDRLTTRCYFEDDPATAEDPLLRLVPEERRPTLIARRAAGPGAAYRFDIVLQGERETVFFDL